MKSKELVIGAAYAVGRSYEKKRRAVVVEVLKGGEVLVDAPEYRWFLGPGEPEPPIKRQTVRICFFCHTWEEEEAKRVERTAHQEAEAALAARALEVVGAIRAPLGLDDHAVATQGFANRGPCVVLTLEAAERIAEQLFRLKGLEK